MENLFSTEIAQRDDAWEFEFLRELARGFVTVEKAETIAGPDGWPYLAVKTGGDEPTRDIAQWLSTRGVGLVINAHKPLPDFVLTYGMIWNFRERGEFLTATAAPVTQALEIRDGQKLLAGPPSLIYLPEYVRTVLRDFLGRQKVKEPKVLMISVDESKFANGDTSPDARWDLAFSLESLGNPPANEHAGIAEALSWFLPAHYSVALVSEHSVPGFVRL